MSDEMFWTRIDPESADFLKETMGNLEVPLAEVAGARRNLGRAVLSAAAGSAADEHTPAPLRGAGGAGRCAGGAGLYFFSRFARISMYLEVFVSW